MSSVPYNEAEGHGLHAKFKAAPIDAWEHAYLEAAVSKDARFPQFAHIPRLGSADLADGVREAFRLYRIVRPHLDKNVGEGKSYLDFGCGVGRIFGTYMRDFHPKSMHGADVTDEFIDTCRASFGDMFTFHNMAPRPPLSLASESVDLITAYSVFSHFSAIQATRWLDEFNRIARPGAIIALTTYGRAHVNFIYDTPSEKVPVNKARHLGPLNQMGGRNEVFRMFGLGEMVYVEKGATFGRYDYGDAFLGEEYVRRIWGRHFEILEVVDDFSRMEQMAVVMRKPL